MLMYADHDKLTHVQRIRAFRDAQEKMAAKYPDDDEAQIAYAITLNTSADLNDKTYAQQMKGAAILEPISQRLPRHPGVTHYLIHLYDYPETAAKGLDAANRYAKIAPAAPHAQHMPSHIYTRVGYWKESIDSNIASVKAAKAEKSVGNYLHAQDYMVYAHLQLGQDKQARAVMDEMMRETDFKATVLAAHYALAASPARYAVERGDWNAASQLQVRPTPFHFVTAISHFARALGAARSGKPDAAKADIAKLAELRDKLRDAKDAYWSEIVDIQRQVAAAWVLYAEGKYDEALKAMSAAADAEDKTEKHAVTPGPLAPARELYGEMLLDRGMAKEALAAFEATKVEGAEPLPRLPRRGAGRREARRQGQGQGQLREARGACRERRLGAAGGRRGEEVSRQQLAGAAMRTVTAIAVAAAFLVGGLVAALAWFGLPQRAVAIAPRPAWTEVAWPFLLDEWGKGKAFHCGAADCGTDVNLYIRAKIGFCNCTTGVADDEELERLSDFDLMGDKIAVLTDGRPISVAWMKGRSRAYAVAKPARAGVKSALSVAFNDRCDAIVATVVLGHDQPAAIEPGVIEFLNGKTVLRWAEVTLGL